MTAIICRDLSKTYRGESRPALNALNLEVPEKSIFGFLGPNGAGKTTTIKILTGIMKASSGYAEISGIPVSIDSLYLRKKTGYLSQEPRLYGWMKARELLHFVGDIFGLDKKERNSRTEFLLELSGLKHASDKKIASFSGGMIQRLGIAQALMGKPEVLFLDEPTSSLDPVGRKEVLDFIASLSEECTVFMSTHILADVERVSTHVAILHQGKLVVQDKTDNLRKKFSSGKLELEFSSPEEKQRFLDEITANLFPGKTDNLQSKIVYTPENKDKEKHLLLNLIAEKKFDIVRFEWVNATLEDVFIDLISQNQT